FRRVLFRSSTCATGRSKKRCHSSISRAWPSAASAWRWAMAAPASAARGRMARPAATAPEETITTSRPASTDEDTNWARPRAKRGDSPPPPSAANRLLPTLSTARRQGGRACRFCNGDAVFMRSAVALVGELPLAYGQVGTAGPCQRIGIGEGLRLGQAVDALQHVGAAGAIGETTRAGQQAARVQVVQVCQVRRDHGRVEARSAHGDDEVVLHGASILSAIRLCTAAGRLPPALPLRWPANDAGQQVESGQRGPACFQLRQA